MSVAATSPRETGQGAPLTWAVICVALAEAAFFATPASAGVITCSFTEPFVRTFYDPPRKTLTIVEDADRQKRVQKGITANQVSTAILELRNANGEIVQRLEHSFRGSDGMSDKAYPYAVQWTPRDPNMPESLAGGCQ
jgi:hypothetical protein